MKINYDFPWYLQNSEGFMALYTGLYDVATNISPISLLSALDIDHTTTPEQLKLIATLYGLRGDFVAIQDALIYNIKKWSVRGSDLPDGYTQLMYLESTGTQYIDTGIKPNQDSSISAGYMLTGEISGNVFVMGCTNTADSNRMNNGFTRMLSPNRVGWGGTTAGSLITITTPTVANTQYNIRFDGRVISINDTVVATSTSTDPWSANFNAYVFARNTAGTMSSGFVGRFYYFRMYDGDTLALDLIPCRRESDGMVGMYDIVNNEFHERRGTGNFVAGPDFPGEFGEVNYWSGRMTETTELLVNYIKAKVQIRNKNLTLQTLKQFFEVCLAHRDFNPSTDISVEESTLHFDLTVSVDGDILNDMVTLLSVDPYPFGKPTGISYSINYVQE